MPEDPPSLWGTLSAAPSQATERTLHSTPDSFTVSGGAGGDVKSSRLETEIASHPPNVIEEILIDETVVTAGSGSGTFSGTAIVTADIDEPITPVVIPFAGFVGSGGTASIDVAAVVPKATRLGLDLLNRVEAGGGGTSASKTSADITVMLPEPAGSLLLPLGCLFATLLWSRRTRTATASRA